jgi:hypothetical protein
MTDAERLEAENARLRRRLWTLAEAALAYDAAIQRRAAAGASWIAGDDDLDALYDAWVGAARRVVDGADGADGVDDDGPA